MKNLKYTLYTYYFAITSFLKSIKPLVVASNYNTKFKLKIIFLDIFFLAKCFLEFLSGIKIKEEKFLGYKVVFPSYLDFYCLFVEMFSAQEYKFISSKKTPIIIDCGSNWGMSIIYFKHFYPDSNIIAIEANKDTAKYLKENIVLNKFSEVKIHVAAVAAKKGPHVFFVNNRDDKWSLSDTGVSEVAESRSDFSWIMVKTIQLSKLITREVDLLKLDIEGMESEVLDEVKGKLSLVREIKMEYHGEYGSTDNSFYKIEKILKKLGFTYVSFGNKGLIPRKIESSLRIIHALNRNVN